MGQFSNLTITEKGRLLLADVQAGGELDATLLAMGKGDIPVGKTAATMTELTSPVIGVDVSSVERTPDGKVIFGGYYSNKELTESFSFKEFGLWARAIYRNEAGEITSFTDEVLYAYGNAGDTADFIPAYTTGDAIEKFLEMVIYVGNETEVNLSVASGIYVPKSEFDEYVEKHAAEAKENEDSLWDALLEHNDDKSNPHNVTPSQIGAAPSVHNHDERYYTEAEVNALLAQRAPFPTWGTDDIEAGSASSSPTGTVHYVVE